VICKADGLQPLSETIIQAESQDENPCLRDIETEIDTRLFYNQEARKQYLKPVQPPAVSMSVMVVIATQHMHGRADVQVTCLTPSYTTITYNSMQSAWYFLVQQMIWAMIYQGATTLCRTTVIARCFA
jgi:hypothetical protein